MPRPDQLVRPRLLTLLEESSDHKATLISAPAGYGKTTLLAQWLQAEEADLSYTWVSLDVQDDDPVRLWRHIIEALRQAVPEEDFCADVIVGMSAAGQKLVQAPLPMLIKELAELPHQVEVVLDDYQLLTEGDSHESVAFFIEHVPENVHLVISSRTYPPLPLGRLRARGELNEIRIEQLAFSEEEAARLLNEKMGLDIGTDDLSVLFERTEGWPAAIYLAYLSLQQREDKHAFIASFGGSSDYIVDLLVEDVLAGLSEEVRAFLLMTSVLRRITGPLCDAVVDREGSARLLRELARSNLFVVPLDEHGEWYRYHHLFSDLLLYELKSSRPELLSVLHGRASAWSEGAGFFDGAIRHAIAAKDYERAGMLIARHSFAYIFTGQMVTVERWLESLPEDSVGTDAALALMTAWMSALYGRREETERYLALAESIPYEGPLPDGTASVESGAALVRGVFGYGGVQAMAGAIQNAAELESKQISPRTVLACLGLGLNFYGFIGGEDNQWYPSLCEGTTPIEPPKTPEEGYHLTEDLADHAVTWVRKQKTLAPDKPFFMYFAPGATHAPLHVPEEWIEKYKGKFAHGWDRQRELTFARQKELGVIPQDADLTERHEEIPAWDDTDDDLKPILERGMEIYAGFMSHVDHHVGRLLDTIEELGIMDDTLIYLIIGDNGASAEGTHNGSFNEMISLNGMAALETPEFLAAHLDEFGGPKAYTHYAIGSGLTTYPRRCERSYTSCSACS